MKIITVEIWVPEDANQYAGTLEPGPIAHHTLAYYAQEYGANILTDEAIVKRAENISYQEYRQTVRNIVANMIDEIKSGDIETEDAAQDWLHQTIDGHHDVIYTACAKDILRYSENADAMEDEFGTDELVRDGAINWSGMAYCALLADVQAEIDGLSKYFVCRDCQYAVPSGMGETDWTRDEDGLPLCADCAHADKDDPRSAESI